MPARRVRTVARRGWQLELARHFHWGTEAVGDCQIADIELRAVRLVSLGHKQLRHHFQTEVDVAAELGTNTFDVQFELVSGWFVPPPRNHNIGPELVREHKQVFSSRLLQVRS